ncbi:aldehyde dehydrogenase family protein [Pseudomonas sp. HLT2-19-2]
MHTAQFQSLLPDAPAHFIGGQWHASQTVRDSLNPATEAVIGQVADGDRSTAALAVENAHQAQKGWAALSIAVRADYLQGLLEQVKDNAEGLARLLVTEQGKPIKEARGEVGMALTMLRYYAGFGFRQTGSLMAADRQQRSTTIRDEPFGVVAAIIPWNFPLAMFVRKLAPVLVAGNTLVIKPSENTPLIALAMATLCQRAKLPAGVVNVVTGPGKTVGDALVRHPLTSLVTMTGSTRAGREILAAAAENILPVSLELGGKAPFIVMADADVERAARDALASRMHNCGQACIANERTYVHASVYPQFMEALLKAARQLRIGDPHDESTDIGPKVSAAERESVFKHIAKAQEQGAQVAYSGTPADSMGKGFWVAPTILTDLPADAEIFQSEVFGPVLPVIEFTTLDQVIEWANRSEYGLSAYVYTRDLRTAMQLTDALESGEVYINRAGPEEINGYHAGWKRSGLGGDDGEHGYRTYVRTKTVYLDYSL